MGIFKVGAMALGWVIFLLGMVTKHTGAIVTGAAIALGSILIPS